jgi:predicted LPLAT superfamily acyltransferase
MSATRTLWSEKAERGSEALIMLIVWLARVAGRSVCRGLLYPITMYFVLTDATARRASAEFLGAVYGRPAKLTEVFKHVYAFAATLLDRVYLAMGRFNDFDVTVTGLDVVENALKAGKGCVMLGSHLGSFDLLMLAHREKRGHAITVMMQVDPRARLRRIAGIDENAFNVIRVGEPGSYLRAHEAIERGEIVGILADRVDHGAPGLRVLFLGREVTLPVAPHVLAARTGAPVILCFGLYEGGRRYRLEFVDFGPTAERSSRGAALQPMVERYAAVLEQYSRRHPLNWFNFYPYWLEEKGGLK